MFTIKHIHFDGSEEIIEAESVRFTPGTGPSNIPPTLWIVALGTVGERPLTGGTIFVMNSAGKTVARYDLSGAGLLDVLGHNEPRA